MSDAALLRLAKAAGLSAAWVDANGRDQRVSPDTLRTVLCALGYAADTPVQIADSAKAIRDSATHSPPLITARSGGTLTFAAMPKHVRLTTEDGRALDLARTTNGGFRAPTHPGYYRFEAGNIHGTLAVAPRRAFPISAVSDRQLWGIAVQVYALREGMAGGFGDFGALAAFARDAAAAGADAVTISPLHALFGARPTHISPYSPSSRLFLNPLYIATERPWADPHSPLIDWPRAAREKMAALKEAFDCFQANGEAQRPFEDFVRRRGDPLLSHARFEVLDARFCSEGKFGWRNWPTEWQDSKGAPAQLLKADDPRVVFQLFLQWQAETGLARAQEKAISAGMAIGLIGDMAVGIDPEGSSAWASPDQILKELNVGCPPDIFNTAGQDWGLTTFSPMGLKRSGYGGYIGTLRAAMRNVGGMRLDHAIGLRRLWLVPRGMPSSEGVYLDYPMRDMMRLIALESFRNRCIVIAEDLGTVPAAFRETIAKSKLYGMRVLWFERGADGAFIPPGRWGPDEAALSTTHDLPTVAGWWSDRDITWRRKLGAPLIAVRREKRERARDRKALWRALKAAQCATGALPPPVKPAAAIDGSLAFLGQTDCPLVIVAAEDFIDERDQPNLPGTIDEHPNWRRRLAAERLFTTKAARRRAKILTKSRNP